MFVRCRDRVRDECRTTTYRSVPSGPDNRPCGFDGIGVLEVMP